MQIYKNAFTKVLFLIKNASVEVFFYLTYYFIGYLFCIYDAVPSTSITYKAEGGTLFCTQMVQTDAEIFLTMCYHLTQKAQNPQTLLHRFTRSCRLCRVLTVRRQAQAKRVRISVDL